MSGPRCYSSRFTSAYFVPGALAFGETDALGEGLAAGLGLLTGAVSVAPLVDVEVVGVGVGVAGVFELLSVAQPAAKMIENVVTSSSAVRLKMLMFVVVIIFLPRSSKIVKRDDDCPNANW